MLEIDQITICNGKGVVRNPREIISEHQTGDFNVF